ncbi:MAG: anion permease [candidate division Zixibacteria bacterium]|nr:anion permease [Candidatus Tariuqbacter arcticus]
MKSSIWKIFAGLALFIITLILPGGEELSPEGQKMAAIAVLMAFWWVTEAIPISATALLMMVPAAIAASCAFMLPVATPPNAIVFGSGYVTIPVMAKKGLAMNILGIALISALTYLVVAPFIGGLACDLMK